MGNNDIKVRDLADTSSITVDNQLMVLTDDDNNTVQNITVKDFLTNIKSSNSNNAIVMGSDNKLYSPNLSSSIGNLTNLNTTDKTSLVNSINEVNDKVNTVNDSVGSLSSLNTADKSSIVNAVNEINNSATVQDERLHALKGYSDEGELLTDTELYNDVYSYAHSTFDLSKFTAVGTPSVSSSGIASGFSSSNYYKSVSAIDCTKPFQIIFNEKRGSSTKFNGFQLSKSGSDATSLFFVQSPYETYMSFGLYLNGTLSIHDYSFNHADYTDINYFVTWTGSVYTLEIRNAITNETILSETVNSSTSLANGESSSGVIIYGYNFNNASAIQSTDLKQTIAKQNGEQVFSGNKTGIDTIVENNYTVVGSPTITNGVASGFSTSNLILSGTYLQNLGSVDNWMIELYITTASTLTNYQYIMSGGNTSSDFQGFVLGMTSSGEFRLFLGSTGTSWNIANSIYSNYTVGASEYVGVRLRFTGTQYILSSKSSGQDWVTQITITNSNKIFSSNLPILFGSNTNSSSAYWRGSIDLNTIREEANGKTIYNSKLQIPYTLSKTGSKIVDSYYRDKVLDVYSQFGGVNYYTIDEENQNATLPMGEVYGNAIKRADGEWQNIQDTMIELSSATAVGVYDIDLSNYIPNDNYQYECVFESRYTRTDTSTANTNYYVLALNNNIEAKEWFSDWVRGGSSTYVERRVQQYKMILPAYSRTIRVRIVEQALSSHGLKLLAWRRLGANY